MVANEKPDRGDAWRQQVVSLLLGALLAIAGGAVTTWLGDYFDRKAESRRERDAETALLAAFQAEIEANIFGLKGLFSNYESADTAGRRLELRKVDVSTTIFKENAGKISIVRDVRLVSEIVALYAGLNWINSWPSIDSPQDTPKQQVARRHASQVANVLYASLYLQARLASRTEELRHPLSKPSFTEQQQNLLRRIQAFRQKAGARPPEDSLDFHGETREPRLQ